jgi:hypothetical protein
VTIAIAPDWSPSGSNGMVEELQYAAQWNSRQPQKIFDAPDFVQMTTANAAKLGGASDKDSEERLLHSELSANYKNYRFRTYRPIPGT